MSAPERIWAYHNGNSQTYLTAPNKFHNVEFVRADIAASQIAEARAEAASKSGSWVLKRCVDAEAERDRLAADNARKDAEIARLREALEFYGDISKYSAPFTGGMGALWSDCGQVARNALAGKE